MRFKMITAVAAVAVCSAVALTGIASAGTPAKTTVTITPESDGVFGFVSSPKKQKCANGRKITVYKQKGSKQKPRNDQKIGSDIAGPNGNKIMWDTGNSGHMAGRFYAHAGRTGSCKPDNSRSVKMLPAT